jgi:hypothetical protein
MEVNVVYMATKTKSRTSSMDVRVHILLKRMQYYSE